MNAGCGGNSPSPAPPPVTISHDKYLYVVNSADWTVSSFVVAASGALSPVAGGSVGTQVSSPTGVAVSPAGALYVGSADSRYVATFSIDAGSGKLSLAQVTPTPTPGSNSPWNKAGKLAVCGSQLVSFGESFFDVQHTGVPTRFGWGGTNFTIGSAGLISFGYMGFYTFGMSDPAPSNASAAPDSSCSLIFHASESTNTIVAAGNDALNHAAISYVLSAPVGTAPVDLATDSTFRFLFAVNSRSNTISAFTINKSAVTLNEVAGSPFSVGTQPASVLVVQKWIYVTNSGDNTVSAFSMDDSSGVLTPVAGSPFPAGNHPAGMTSTTTDLSHSESGMLLYVANQGSNNVSAFTIAANGALRRVSGSPFATGSGPSTLAVTQPPQ